MGRRTLVGAAGIGVMLLGLWAWWFDHGSVGVAVDRAVPILQADLRGERFPVGLSAEGVSLAQAYAIQDRLVLQQTGGASPGGFKGGLTNDGGPASFGLSEPIGGVLVADRRVVAGGVVDLVDFHRPMLEAEIAFIVGQRIDQPPASLALLQSTIAAVAPAFELPDLGFAGPPHGLDIVANNVIARRYLIGTPVDWARVSLDSLTVSVSHNGQPLLQTPANEPLGGQWQALAWLVEWALARGYTLEPGQVLITGALGGMQPLQAGRYQGDWQALGRLEFEAR